MFILDNAVWSIFFLAFGLGLLHALDADHIMAVTAISAKQGGAKAIVRLCLNWSLGHGATLLVFGVIILFLGLSIPHSLSQYAEIGVAIILIMIGIMILRDLYVSKSHIHFHQHDKLSSHAHWHQHTKNKKESNHNKKHESHNHGAVLVGAIHGLAGLAPLLAIMPMAQKSIWFGVAYLLIFCAGVFLSMTLFGGVFSKLIFGLQRYGNVSINIIRGTIATISISIGGIWLVNGVAL
ncbi:MAG: hypothetical protein QM484_07825 [Woeseiaceae bacterium]